MKVLASYGLACAVIITVLGATVWAFASAADRRLLPVSGLVALGVQLLALGCARLFAQRRVMLGWGLGTGVRFLALVLYAAVVAKLWRAPVTTALLSFVGFLFATTVVEPLFLKR